MSNIHSINRSIPGEEETRPRVQSSPISKRMWRKKSAKKEMHEMLRQNGLSHQAACAFGWWPTLENSCVELIMHLGSSQLLVNNNDSLAHATIRMAIRSFDSTYASTAKIDNAVKSFLESFLAVADDLTSQRIYAEMGEQIWFWEPFRQSYDIWREEIATDATVKISGKYFIFDDDLLVARRMLATLTLSKTDYKLAFNMGA